MTTNLPTHAELWEAIQAGDLAKIYELTGVRIQSHELLEEIADNFEHDSPATCRYCDERVDMQGMLCRRHEEESACWEAGDVAYHTYEEK